MPEAIEFEFVLLSDLQEPRSASIRFSCRGGYYFQCGWHRNCDLSLFKNIPSVDLKQNFYFDFHYLFEVVVYGDTTGDKRLITDLQTVLESYERRVITTAYLFQLECTTWKPWRQWTAIKPWPMLRWKPDCHILCHLWSTCRSWEPKVSRRSRRRKGRVDTLWPKTRCSSAGREPR